MITGENMETGLEVKVAVVGPEDLVDSILLASKAFPALKLFPFSYKHEQETTQYVQQCKDETDVFLFAGPIPYQIAREHVDEHKPMIYLPYTGTSLYRVFFRLLREINDLKGERLRFSIDILRQEEIQERLEELELAVEQMFVKEYCIGQQTNEIVQFHYELWKSKKVDAALTCVASVYRRLIDLGVPSYRIVPTRSAIHECLHLVQLEGKSVHLSDTQIAIGIISVDDFSQNRRSSDYDLQRRKLAVHQVLLDYGEEIQALMNWADCDEIRFVTTRGVMERTTHNFSRFPLLEEIVNKAKVNVSIGIGLGRTAKEAESKAREALSKAKLSGGGSCYVVMLEGNVLGPLGRGHKLEYSVRSDDPKRLHLARQAELSVGTINRLISFCRCHGSSKLTAAELANGLGITIRSARRILSKLEQSQLACVIGEEQPVGKGRPRQLYQLKLDT